MGSLTRIALRNVLRNRRRSLLTSLAVILGIGALVGVRGFLNGFQEVIVLNLAEGRTGALAVHHPRYLSSEAVPGVRAAAPRIAFPAAVSVGDETGFAQVLAIDPAREARALPRAREAVVAGRPIAGPGEALLGAELARGLGARLGDTATFVAPDHDGVLNGMEARVVGLLAYKQPGDKRVAQVALADADALLRMDGRITEVAVSAPDPQGPRLAGVRARLEAALGPAARVATWSELASWLADMLLFQSLLFGILAATVAAVSVTGIANAMLLSVLERVREIGTLMALGVRRRSILVLFLLESGFLGLLGGLVGAALGLAAVAAMNRIGIDIRTPGTSASSLVRPWVGVDDVAGAAALAWLGAVLAAVHPARRASRLRPVEALSRA